MTDFVSQYIAQIEKEEIKVSAKVRQLYLSIVKPAIDGKSKRWEYRPKKGELFIRFAENLSQSKGKWAGKPLHLCLFQKAKWQAIFSIVDRETGNRRFRETFDVRGRKNGKSTEHGAVALYLTASEPGAEIYAAATVSSQARRIWEESQSMIDQCEPLQELFGYKVFPSPTIYTKTPIKSLFKVLSKNVKTFDGLNASGAVIDEIHELPRQIYDILKQSMSTREQPLLSMITTAGFVRGGLYDDEYQYAKRVLDSADPNTGETIDDTLFPLIYELDSPEEIENEDCWIKANPAIDVIKSREELRGYVTRMRYDLNFANTVKTKDFNIIGVEQTAWLPGEEIEKCRWGCYSPDEVGQDESDPKRQRFLKKFDRTMVLGGFDLSQAGDMTAWVTLLFDQDTGSVIIMPMAWVSQRFLDSDIAKASRAPFKAWLDRGIIRLGGSEIIDYSLVSDYCLDMVNRHGWVYSKIGYDPYNSSYLVGDFVSKGFMEDLCLNKVRQGFLTLGEPMKVFAEMLRTKKITCLNNPLFLWALSNVETVADRNGNLMPKKLNSNPANKIDPVAAALDAFVPFIADHQIYLP